MATHAPETHLLCPRCRAELPQQFWNSGQSTCVCGARLQVKVFPAFHRPAPQGATAQVVVDEGESPCFYHEQKRAATSCSACGRFLCALCDVELNGQHLCPVCLSGGQRKNRLPEIERERILYDNIALMTAILPIFMLPFTIMTAPAAVVMSMLWWKKPTSIIPRSRVRYILAIAISGLQIGAWCVIFAFMLRNR
jgi:hypothetical protein